MSCAAWEERVALAAGGEIERSEVEEHLAACADCRALYADLEVLRRELAGFDAPGEAEVAALHSAVMGQVSRHSIPVMRYAVAAAIAALVLGWTALRHPAVTAPSAPVAPSVVAHALSVPSRSPDRPLRRVRTKPPVRLQPPATQEPTIIHMQTEDPDVVIIWIAE